MEGKNSKFLGDEQNTSCESVFFEEKTWHNLLEVEDLCIGTTKLEVISYIKVT